jgi:hypothetical protein
MVPSLHPSQRNRVLFPLLLAGSFLMMYYIVQADKAAQATSGGQQASVATVK